MSALQYDSNLGDVCSCCGDPAPEGNGSYCYPCGDELSDAIWDLQHLPGEEIRAADWAAVARARK